MGDAPKTKADKIKHIAAVNDDGVGRAAQAKPLYDSPIATNPRNPMGLIAQLSKNHPSMVFMLKYVAGAKTIHAEPFWSMLVVPPDGQAGDVEHCFQQALKAEAKVDRELWPSHAELCAYARGYNDGPDNTEELQRAKDELKAYKEAERRGPFLCPPPWAFGRGPWY